MKMHHLTEEDMDLLSRLPQTVRQSLLLAKEIEEQIDQLPGRQDPTVKRRTLRKVIHSLREVALDRAKASVRHKKQHDDVLRRLRNARNLVRRYQLQATELRATIRDLKEGSDTRAHARGARHSVQIL